MRRAADSLRAHAAQLQEQNPHRSPNVVRQMATTADRVDLGHHTHVPTMEARFRNPAPAHAEQGQPTVIDGQVTGVEFVPAPRTSTETLSEGIQMQQGREQYGRHDSGETRESLDTGAHYKEGTLMSERIQALPNKPSKQFESMQGMLNEAPYVREQYHNQSDIIGTDAWHAAQQEQAPEYNPHEVSIGADAEGPVKWLTGAEAKAVVQEQQGVVPEQPIAEAKTEDTSGDDEWQARQARRRERLIRMQNSVKPGGYTPDVIGAQPTNEDDQHQKAA